MTDKVQKIREEVVRLQDLTMDENKNFYSEAAEGEYNALCNIEHFIDSMQEEPTTSVWHNTRSEEPIVGRNIVMMYYNHIYSGEYLGERFFGREKFTLMSDSKWAYFDDLIKL